MIPKTEAKFFMSLPPATRLSGIERVHHCMDLLYTLPPAASRDACIDVLGKHLHEIFAAHYSHPITPFVPRVPAAAAPLSMGFKIKPRPAEAA